MPQIVDLVAIVVVLAFLVLGILRGLLREVLVLLGGIVLGVLLSGIWVDAWAASRTVQEQGIWRLVSFFAIVVLVGYGSSLFLPNERPNWRQRLAGAGVGFLNGLLLLAFTFQFIQRYIQPAADSTLQKGLISRVLIIWLPTVLVIIAGLVILAVVVAAMIKLFHFFARLTQPPETAPAPAVPPPTTQGPFTPAPTVSTPAPTPTPSEPAATPPANVPTISCPNCNSTIPADSVYCPNCGKILK